MTEGIAPLSNSTSLGRQDAPEIVQWDGSPPFDIDDADGRLFMLDRSFAGAISVTFSKPMDLSVRGTVSLEGERLDYIFKSVSLFRTMDMLVIPLFGLLSEYDTDYSVQIEGFTDTDGVAIIPAAVTVHTKPQPEPDPRYADHDQIALRAAEEGIVLLENRAAVLPLPAGQLNVFGQALIGFRTSIVGAGKINPRYTIGFCDAVRHSEGFSLNEELVEFYRRNGNATPERETLERARAASDIGIVILSRASGENMDNSSDKGEFELRDDEDALIAAIAQEFDRTIVLLNTPYPINTSFMERHDVHGLVLAGVGGMLAGPALVHVLDGSVNPSGKLPDTWVNRLIDIPAHRNFYDCADGKPRYGADDDVWIDTVYEEGIYIGYRYFSTFGVDVAYPFGHGMSYTTFDLKVERVDSPATCAQLKQMKATITVTNKGDVPGREVVQLYVSKPQSYGLEQPALELVGYVKTRLLARDESERITIPIPERNLASFDETTASFTAPAGEYALHVGNSVTNTVEAARFILDVPHVVRQDRHRMLPVAPISVLSSSNPRGTYPTGSQSGVKSHAFGFTPEREAAAPVISPRTTNTPVPTFIEVRQDPSRVHDFVAGLTVEQCARMVVCAKNGWGMEGTGVAGIAAQPEGLDIPLFQVADGNSGVNVNTPNIGMPTTVVLASTFDRDLVREVGRVIGEEAREQGVNGVLAPALNLHRHPLNGRHPEYFSEDPLLTGTLAGAFAAGLESTGVGACYKHIAGNNAESSRKRNQSIIPERALRELYLAAFEYALAAHHPAAIMTSYNAINGLHTAADTELIDGVFRGEFDFDGMVMTDWNAYDTVDVVDMLLGGMNWLTPGSDDDTYTRPLVAAVRSGRLPEGRLRESAAHLLGAIAKLTGADAPTNTLAAFGERIS